MKTENVGEMVGEAFCNTTTLGVPAQTVFGINVLATIFFGGAAVVIDGLAPPSVLVGAFWLLAGFIGAIPLVVLLVILHEATHWIAFRAFGARKARFMWVMRNGKPIAPSVSGREYG